MGYRFCEIITNESMSETKFSIREDDHWNKTFILQGMENFINQCKLTPKTETKQE